METKVRESAARRKILETAADLFYRNGIRATGIDTIIDAADVARMTLYKYFPTKEALVEAVLEESAHRSQQRWDAVAADATRTPRERLLRLFEQVGETMRDSGYRGCPFVRTVAEMPDPGSSLHCAALSHKAALWQAVAQCVRDLGVSNEVELTEQLILLIDGASVRAQLGLAEQATSAAKAAAILLIDHALGQVG